MKTYCSTCGFANGYTGKKPNFCCSCGHKFSTAAEQEAIDEHEKLHQTQLAQSIEEGKWEPTTAWQLPTIQKLDVEIDTTDGYKKYKFGEVIGTLNPDDRAESQDGFIHPEKQTNEQVLQSIEKESKTLREKK